MDGLLFPWHAQTVPPLQQPWDWSPGDSKGLKGWQDGTWMSMILEHLYLNCCFQKTHGIPLGPASNCNRDATCCRTSKKLARRMTKAHRERFNDAWYCRGLFGTGFVIVKAYGMLTCLLAFYLAFYLVYLRKFFVVEVWRIQGVTGDWTGFLMYSCFSIFPDFFHIFQNFPYWPFLPKQFGLRNVSVGEMLAESSRSPTIANLSRLTEVPGGKGHVIYLPQQHTLFIFAGMFSRFGLKTLTVNRHLCENSSGRQMLTSVVGNNNWPKPVLRLVLYFPYLSVGYLHVPSPLQFVGLRTFRLVQGCSEWPGHLQVSPLRQKALIEPNNQIGILQNTANWI